MALGASPWRRAYSAFPRRGVCCRCSTNWRIACSGRRSDLWRSDVHTQYPRIPLPRLCVAYVDLARHTVADVDANIPQHRCVFLHRRGLPDRPKLRLTKRREEHQGKRDTSESFRPPDGKGAQCESIPTRPLVVRPGNTRKPRLQSRGFFIELPVALLEAPIPSTPCSRGSAHGRLSVVK